MENEKYIKETVTGSNGSYDVGAVYSLYSGETIQMKKLKVSAAVKAICKALANDEASLNILATEIYEAENKKRRKKNEKEQRKLQSRRKSRS